jgi:type IV pilus assembly protein PilM
MPAAGFDISDLSLKYVKLGRKNKDIYLQNFGKKSIPEDLIKSGEIKNKEKLTDLLKSVQKETGLKYIIASLPEERGFLGKTKIPKIKKDEIKNAIELQMEELIPLPVEEVIFDFDIIERADKKNDNHIDIIFVAFPRKIVEDYRDVLIDAGFIPLVFEMEAQAFKRCVVSKEDMDTQIIVDLGKTRTTLIIIDNNVIQFTTTFNVAGDNINNILSKNLSINTNEAEKIMKESGFVKSKSNETVFNSLLPIVSAIKDEISRSVIFWDNHPDWHSKDQNKISKIILCGGISNMKGLPQYLSYELKIPVIMANPGVNIISLDNYVPVLELSDSLTYTTPLGLALRTFNY